MPAAAPAIDDWQPIGGAGKPPAEVDDWRHPFGTDEYINDLAKKHDVDPKWVRKLAGTQSAAEPLRGIPIAGGFLEKAGAGISAATGGGASGGSLGERYSKNLALEEELKADYEREHPIASTLAQLGGGAVATGGLGATATGARLLGAVGGGIGKQMAAGAASGGVINAADAAMRGENPVVGGLIGAGLGAAAPVVGAVGSRLAQPLIQTVRGAINPSAQAARNVATGIERDVQAGSAGMTQPEFQRAVAQGQPANLMDIGGETTRALARSAANTSPEGRQILTQAIDQRFEGQAQRMSDWFNSQMNYPTKVTRDYTIRNIAENVYEPRYAQAYKDSAGIPLWPDRDLTKGMAPAQQAALHDLADVAQAPEVQQAIRLATPQLRNWAVRDGLSPPAGAFMIDTSGSVPRTVLKQTASGNTILPSLQYWDYIKRGLDRMETPTSKQFAHIIRDRLDTLVPSYQAARAAAQPAKFFEGAPNALEAGRNFFGRGERFGPDAQAQITRMTPEERGLFQDGYASALLEKIERSGDRRNVVNNIANSVAARREIGIALGPQRLNELQAKLHLESIMDSARGAVQGNSTTARQLAELGLAGGVGLISSGGNLNPAQWDPATVIHAALMYGAAKGQGRINANVSRQVAQLLASHDVGRLQTGMRMIAGNPQMRNALRIADQALARSAAVQVTPGPDQNKQTVH